MKEHKFKIGDHIYDNAFPDEVYYVYDTTDEAYEVKWVNEWGEIDYALIRFDEEEQHSKANNL